MKFRVIIAGAVAIFGLAIFFDANLQGGDKKDPASVKVVMHKAMKGGLCARVLQGKASADEKQQLIALLTDLAANKCPKGNEADWKERTQALLRAAKADDSKALAKAADCTGCHAEHK